MVDVHYIVVEGSIDERAFWCLNRKKKATSIVVDGEAHTFNPEATVTAQPPDRAPASREGQLQELEALRTAREEERLALRAAVVEERAAQRAQQKEAQQKELLADRAAKAAVRAHLQCEKQASRQRQQEAKRALKEREKKTKAELRQKQREVVRETEAQMQAILRGEAIPAPCLGTDGSSHAASHLRAMQPPEDITAEASQIATCSDGAAGRSPGGKVVPNKKRRRLQGGTESGDEFKAEHAPVDTNLQTPVVLQDAQTALTTPLLPKETHPTHEVPDQIELTLPLMEQATGKRIRGKRALASRD